MENPIYCTGLLILITDDPVERAKGHEWRVVSLTARCNGHRWNFGKD